MTTLGFILYAGSGSLSLTDQTRRSEHGSVDEALAAFEWLRRGEKLDWAAIVRAEDGDKAWEWEAESFKPLKPEK